MTKCRPTIYFEVAIKYQLRVLEILDTKFFNFFHKLITLLLELWMILWVVVQILVSNIFIDLCVKGYYYIILQYYL